MSSERVRRTIENLLDEAEQAVSRSEWAIVRDRAQNVLAFEPDNQDAGIFLAAAERAIGGSAAPSTSPLAASPTMSTEPSTLPTSFANGRYQVKKFLGEGGKKKVYLATDTLLDRDVAFALIQTNDLEAI